MKARPALPEDIKELMRLVRAGKLFAVQKWIAGGKPVTSPKPYWFSPFRVAVKTGFHSMVELLLQQGVEADEQDYMLNQAVWDGNFEIIKLLVEHGADIHSVDFEDVCRTGHPFIIHFFLDRGMDAETGQPFARALCYPKRRYLGVYMSYRDKIPSFRQQLNLALKHHAHAGNLKWVSLLLWAGGDPHLRLPAIGEKPNSESDSSAIEDAVDANRYEVVDKIGIDPKRDNIDRMFEHACLLGHTKMVEKLLVLGANPKGKGSCGRPMECSVHHLIWEMEEQYGLRSESGAKEALAGVLKLADLGARWVPSSSHLRRLRSQLYHFDASMAETLVKSFHEHNVCALEVLLKLIRQPKMKTLLGFRHTQLIKLLKSQK